MVNLPGLTSVSRGCVSEVVVVEILSGLGFGCRRSFCGDLVEGRQAPAAVFLRVFDTSLAPQTKIVADGARSAAIRNECNTRSGRGFVA